MDVRRSKLRAFALSLPDAYEDHPWNESVAKAGTKVFVFLGQQGDAGEPAITVKLVESHGHALAVDGALPTGYGLGKSGWVTVPVGDVPLAVLRDWIEESYRIVAPKRLVSELEDRTRRPSGRRDRSV
jgi:predicted DNA-binding protein (MmcQ/YjbR family)